MDNSVKKVIQVWNYIRVYIYWWDVSLIITHSHLWFFRNGWLPVPSDSQRSRWKPDVIVRQDHFAQTREERILRQSRASFPSSSYFLSSGHGCGLLLSSRCIAQVSWRKYWILTWVDWLPSQMIQKDLLFWVQLYVCFGGLICWLHLLASQ